MNKLALALGVGAAALVVLVAVIALAYRHKDPAVYVARAEAAVAAGDHEAAVLNYRQALGATRVRGDKVPLLFKLAEAYVQTDQWAKVLACWNQIVVEDPGNLRARLALLAAAFVQADSQTRAGWQVGAIWKEVETQASELLEVATAAGVLETPTATWRTLDWQRTASAASASLGPFLHLRRGRAAYEQARIGAVADPNAALTRARTDVETVRRARPDDVTATWLLSQILTEQAEAAYRQGDKEARRRAAARVDSLLAEAVTRAPDDAQAHTYALEARVERIRTQVEDLAERRRQLAGLERDYDGLVQRFADRPVVFASQARFYWTQAFFADPDQRDAGVERAVAAARRARELAPERVDLCLALGELYYRQAVMIRSREPLVSAVAVGREALASPEARATSGPRTFANKANRLSIQAFLAHASIEHLLMDTAPPDPDMLAQARESVAQVEQLLSSRDDPEVAKWRGLLQMAEGHPQAAIATLYPVYVKTQASRASGRTDPVLSYALARICLETPELGKALEFLAAALKSGLGYVRPYAILDYLDLLGQLDLWPHVIASTNAYNLDAYERYFGADARSRVLRVRALIGTGRWSEAEAALQRLGSGPETVTLRLEWVQARLRALRGGGADESGLRDRLQQQRLDLLRRQRAGGAETMSPDALVAALQAAWRSGQLGSVQDLVTDSAALEGDNLAVGLTRRLIAEPDPEALTPEHRAILEEQACRALSDPERRDLELGRFHQRYGRARAALAAYQAVLATARKPAALMSRTPAERQRRARRALAAGLAMQVALEAEDWKAAQAVVDRVRATDLDACGGALFEAQLAQARGRRDRALERINACLAQRPLYAQGYLLRSRIQAASGRLDAALADATEAATLNPLDPVIAKAHAERLLQRNQRLADRVTAVQEDEAVRALARALRLDPTDPNVLDLYARHTVQRDPAKAVAIYQALTQRYPTLENALTLGDLALHAAGQETDGARRQVYQDVARDAYAKAKAIAPEDTRLLERYARYYRATGQSQQAESLLQGGPDEALLWRHYLREGRLDEARALLEEARQRDPQDEAVLRALLAVAGRQQRGEEAEGLGRALIEAADTLDNRIEQITTLLRLGRVRPAETALREAEKRYGDAPRMALLSGWVALRLGRLDEALSRMDEALKADADSAVAWYLRGQAQLLSGEATEAVTDLRRSKALADSPATRLTLARALLGAQREQEAIAELRDLVGDHHAPTQAARLLETLYRKAGQTGALTELIGTMRELHPDDLHWSNRAGALALRQGRPEEAARLFEEAAAARRRALKEAEPAVWFADREFLTACHGAFQARLAGPQALERTLAAVSAYAGTPFEPVARLYAAEARLRADQRGAAMNDLKRVLQGVVSGGDAGPLVAGMVRQVGQDAVEQLCEAMTRSEADAQAGYTGLFHLRAAQGRIDEALEMLGQARARTERGGPAYRALEMERARFLTAAYGKTGAAHYRDEAVAAYESLLQKSPTNSHMLNNVAFLLAESREHLPEALAYAERAWAAAPDQPEVLDTYGAVLLEDGQTQRAVEVLTAAQQQYEQRRGRVPAAVYEHVGRAWEALGQTEKAQRAFERARAAEGGPALSEAGSTGPPIGRAAP